MSYDEDVPSKSSSTMHFIKFGVGLLTLVWLLVYCFGGGSKESSPIVEKLPFDTSAAMQAKRLEMIHKLEYEGIFHKVEVPGRLAHIWVDGKFYSLDFETKQKFVGVVYAYYRTIDHTATVVVLKDRFSGKEVGTFDQMELDLK